MTRLNDALAARFTDADEIKDVANYGCSGGVSGFIYYKEIRDFFNEYEDDIENTIADLGYDIKDLADAETNGVMELINKMVWIVVEDYCQQQAEAWLSHFALPVHIRTWAGRLSEGLTLSTTSRTHTMFTSNRIPHDSGLYHEHIFHNNKIVAQLLSEEDGSFWYVLTHNNSLSRGYHSMAAAKKQLCLSLNRIYNWWSFSYHSRRLSYFLPVSTGYCVLTHTEALTLSLRDAHIVSPFLRDSHPQLFTQGHNHA